MDIRNKRPSWKRNISIKSNRVEKVIKKSGDKLYIKRSYFGDDGLQNHLIPQQIF